jgi:anti-sigma B factor antagonist
MELPIFHISRREHDKVAVLAASGRITLGQSVRTLRDTFQDLASQGEKNVVLDMSDVPYLDSAGLGTIVSGLNLFKQNGGSLVLSSVQPRIAQLLELTNLTDVLRAYPNESSAVESLQPAS